MTPECDDAHSHSDRLCAPFGRVGDPVGAGRFEAAALLAVAITAVSAVAFHHRNRLIGPFTD